jgi:cystathionine beta-lyase/cystathionine gamma-synthase
LKFSTRAIHAHQDPDSQTGAVVAPLYLTTTYVQDGIGLLRGGYEYSRTNNPTRAVLEGTVASLENAQYGLCFSSGSAASTAVLNILEPGDEVLSIMDVYGGTYRLFTKVYARYGIQFRFLYVNNVEDVIRKISSRTRMIWVESPTNPLLNIIDIRGVAKGKGNEVLFVVDNTFATPYFQTPLDLGADIVIHSTTKYLGGHSDVIGGALVTNIEDLYKKCKFYQNAAGAVPSPFDSFLIQRGLKTLEVRMLKHQENAYSVAHFLEEHSRIKQVYFPGLKRHPNYNVAQRQMKGQAGMVAFRLEGRKSAVERFLSRLKIFTLAESLGGIESLVCHPYSMTHGAIPPEEKLRIGITEDLVRLSVGIEAEEDLVQDLKNALQ